MPTVLVFFNLFSAIIPVLVFWTWQSRHLDQQAAAQDIAQLNESEKETRLNAIRVQAARVQVTEFLIFTFFFFALWMNGRGLALVSMVTYLVMSFALSHLQYKSEQPFRKIEATAGERMKLEARTQFMGLLMLGIYFGSVLCVIALFSVIAMVTPLPDAYRFVIMALGIPTGLIAGMTLIRGLYPRFISQMLPNRAMTDEEPKAKVEAAFEAANVPMPDMRVLVTEKFGVHNAMISGFTQGKGWFKPGLFVTDRLVRELTEAELIAVIKHEISHIKLMHGWERVKTGLKSFGYSALILAGIISVCLLLFPPAVLAPIVMLGFFLPLAMQMMVFKDLMRKQEFEADHFAVFKLDASITDLEGALRKIDEWNEITQPNHQQAVPQTHPTTTERVRALIKSAHHDGVLTIEDESEKQVA